MFNSVHLQIRLIKLITKELFSDLFCNSPLTFFDSHLVTDKKQMTLKCEPTLY